MKFMDYYTSVFIPQDGKRADNVLDLAVNRMKTPPTYNDGILNDVLQGGYPYNEPPTKNADGLKLLYNRGAGQSAFLCRIRQRRKHYAFPVIKLPKTRLGVRLTFQVHPLNCLSAVKKRISKTK